MFMRWHSIRTRDWSVQALSRCLMAATVCCAWIRDANADLFTVREDDGNKVTVEARLAGDGQGHMALERTDGRIEVVPLDQILNRQPAPDPDPITPEVMRQRLTEQFGKDKFRSHADQNYVIGMVLAEPLPRQFEKQAAMLLHTGAKFMRTVERGFLKFVEGLKIETVKPRYPLVLLIFETDDDFIAYANTETGGRGLTAGNMLGYYSGLSNRLVIRMSECNTFETPMHEAIHQQVYNRGVLQRLSAAPAWFNEGIATGFEGNIDQISAVKVNPRYARQAMKSTNVDWDDVVADDKAFRGDVLAGEAYAHAWSIHWFLVTKYRKQYIQYLQLLSQKKPLQKDDAQTRLNDFEEIFGKTVGKLQGEFPKALTAAARAQNVSLDLPKQPGYLLCQSNLAEVEMTVAKTADGGAEAEGRMRNMSQLRPMSFLITVETDTGTYAEWHLPNVGPGQSQPPVALGREQITRKMQNAPGGPSRSFGVRVRTAVPDSNTAQEWARGQLPVPTYSGQ